MTVQFSILHLCLFHTLSHQAAPVQIAEPEAKKDMEEFVEETRDVIFERLRRFLTDDVAKKKADELVAKKLAGEATPEKTAEPEAKKTVDAEASKFHPPHL